MDRKIVIERATESKGTAGGPVLSWATLKTVWARVAPISGSEALRLNREITSEIARFSVYFFDGLSPKDRINYGSKYWDILNIRELGRRQGIEITAEARA